MDIDVVGLSAGDAVLGAALAVAILLLARANRGFLRDVARDEGRGWRQLPRLAATAGASAVAWITAADDWRQLLDEPLRRAQRFPSDRILLNPTPDAVRTVSLVLLALSLLALAPLVARHVGGYAVQLAALLGAVTLLAPLYALRHRFDLVLATGGDATPSASDLAAYLPYALIAWTLGVAVILLAYTALLMLVAVPTTLILDLTRQRIPATGHDADPFFGSLADRAARR